MPRSILLSRVPSYGFLTCQVEVELSTMLPDILRGFVIAIISSKV